MVQQILFQPPCLWCGETHCLSLMCILEGYHSCPPFSCIPVEAQLPAIPRVAELPHLQEISLSCCSSNTASHERLVVEDNFKPNFRHTHTPTPTQECQGSLHTSALPSIHESIQVLVSWSPVLASLQWHTEDLSCPHVSSASSAGSLVLVLDVPLCTLQGMTVINVSIPFHLCESSGFTHSTLFPTLGDLRSCTCVIGSQWPANPAVIFITLLQLPTQSGISATRLTHLLS